MVEHETNSEFLNYWLFIIIKMSIPPTILSLKLILYKVAYFFLPIISNAK